MRRTVKLTAGALVAAILGAGASASASPPSPVPAPDRLYVGNIFYRYPYTMTIRTSRDGKRLKVAPGYFNRLNRCGALGGDMFTAHIPSRQWLSIRNGGFAGRGSGHVMNFDSGYRQNYAWIVRGRFTSRPGSAAGSITIRGTLTGNGITFVCRPITARWRTHRIALRTDWWDF